MTVDPLVLVAVLAAIGALYLLAKKQGWEIPSWLYLLLGAVGALFSLRRPPQVVAPPEGSKVDATRTAADKVISEAAKEEQGRIERAVTSDTPESDLADLANTRRRG